MNAVELARQAYAPTNNPLKSERSIEAQVIGKITAKLRLAAVRRESDFPAFVDALSKNRKLWNLLATDVAGVKNDLTPTLRAQIYYLAEFTDLHTAKVLRGNATADALVEINTSIMRGLNIGQGN
ncbi:flagellar biosynthesis regulator FlaF [Loktanella sp. F6476L]|uniref:flagellar biosynthesis regulator FlaF n=1 Tax=Loktanella sp. F6476L TaxID=2926405 RepID=UPI001FF32810|nr:flagellar biosynthesis regulator FlaF [Loktanella sp. F6476L]